MLCTELKKKKIYEDPFLEQQLISHYFLRELTDQTTNLPTGGSNRRGCGAEIKTGSGGGRARAPTLVVFILFYYYSILLEETLHQHVLFLFVFYFVCLFLHSIVCFIYFGWCFCKSIRNISYILKLYQLSYLYSPSFQVVSIEKHFWPSGDVVYEYKIYAYKQYIYTYIHICIYINTIINCW